MIAVTVIEDVCYCRDCDLQGYSTGMRLLQATCKVFTAHCSSRGLQGVYRSKGFRMTYSTTIPRMVGLSGSSAIIVAAFRCLLKFFELTLKDLGITMIGNWRCGSHLFYVYYFS